MKYQSSYVPVNEWGHDHWSTLAYVETRVVDHLGRLNPENLRCDIRVHRVFANSANFMGAGPTPPTRLADGTFVERHDDWSCIEDAIAAGFIIMDDEEAAIGGRHDEHGIWRCGPSPRFTLTDEGRRVAGLLREHRARGGKWETFRLGAST